MSRSPSRAKYQEPTAASNARPRRLLVDGRVLDDRYHGVGRVLSTLLPLLAQRPDLDITVVLRPGQQARRFDVAALTVGLGLETVTFDYDLSAPRQYLAWPRLLRETRAEVALYAYNVGAPVFGGAHRFAIVHDCIIESDPRFSPSRRTAVLYRLLTAAVVRRNTVLTPSHASAAAIARYYRVRVPDEHVLSWGVDDRFAEAAERLTEIGGRALPQRYLLHVGARRPHKNVGVLVRALAHLPEDMGLVLVGSVDERMPDDVPALVDSLGLHDRVVHLPHVSDDELRSLYSNAEAFTYPSYVEGVGLPLLEAMSAGTPVVASDIPVFREIAGDIAIYADPDDQESWATAVRSLSDPQLRARATSEGRARAAAASWADTADQLGAILTAKTVTPQG